MLLRVGVRTLRRGLATISASRPTPHQQPTVQCVQVLTRLQSSTAAAAAAVPPQQVEALLRSLVADPTSSSTGAAAAAAAAAAASTLPIHDLSRMLASQTNPVALAEFEHYLRSLSVDQRVRFLATMVYKPGEAHLAGTSAQDSIHAVEPSNELASNSGPALTGRAATRQEVHSSDAFKSPSSTSTSSTAPNVDASVVVMPERGADVRQTDSQLVMAKQVIELVSLFNHGTRKLTGSVLALMAFALIAPLLVLNKLLDDAMENISTDLIQIGGKFNPDPQVFANNLRQYYYDILRQQSTQTQQSPASQVLDQQVQALQAQVAQLEQRLAAAQSTPQAVQAAAPPTIPPALHPTADSTSTAALVEPLRQPVSVQHPIPLENDQTSR
ncbi:hypothetical protein CAOG_03677 [Capsaspora owczarzaki ATCC 30864]|uniref:Uncharacterized protein n=1 Tax=Capsaspora owczarzaki (strain ATCC 30864) TaxID=595528 RepID=A0A0D2UCL0_CAPO3|nr:hypothetical protein CAOG_03677 [Capsaspora owczarzaki ATCC 30864]KJE92776.1 hypothetical protein CAOG_003677 [Capsaspora owczarzaki ATCC 30864]|eukprot:XP_004363405.1 hypothetical protein CAOG_03677 [Capsaspora owczarzaki ATCC 30864]